MARENNIVLSDEELTKLRDVRQAIYGSDEVPYGVVVERLADEYRGGTEASGDD